MQNSILQITLRADIGGGPEHLYKLVKNLSPSINNIIALPKEEPYYSLFKKLVGEKNLIELPHRKFSLPHLIILKKEIKRRNISIIHSHGKGAGIYSRILGFLTGKRVIHTLHGFHVGKYNSFQKRLYIWLEKLLSIYTDKFISVSDGEEKQIIDAGICSKKKIVVIPNGIEITANHQTSDVFEQLPHKIISFSRFDFQKNTELVIDICKFYKTEANSNDIEFHIYGDGEEFEKIKNKINSCGLEQLMVLHGPDSAARDKLSKGFCYISTSRWEGLPISLLEAMAAGLPVIATDVIGNNNIVEHEKDGFLYSIDNPQMAAQYICRLIKDKELWERLSNYSLEKVSNRFNITKMIYETEKIYLA